jgi:hypothetical protein
MDDRQQQEQEHRPKRRMPLNPNARKGTDSRSNSHE